MVDKMLKIFDRVQFIPIKPNICISVIFYITSNGRVYLRNCDIYSSYYRKIEYSMYRINDENKKNNFMTHYKLYENCNK